MRRAAVCSALLVVFAASVALAQPGPANWTRKKLIETGWDEPTTAWLRQNLAEIEKQPFDGILFGAVGKIDATKTCGLRASFCPDPWKREWFQTCVDDLKACKFTRLTDNFVTTGANPGNVDWFDDAGWKNVVEHWRIAAWIAKQGNARGILFDPEPYTEPYAQFRYQAQAGAAKHTFVQYYAKARQRGREVMQAIAQEYPDCTLYCYFMNSVNSSAAGQADPMPSLQAGGYGLYPAFIDGWLDAIPPTVTLVDGCESAYLYNSPGQFLESAVMMKGDAQSLVSPENRRKYRAQVQTSFGIYLDAYANPPTSPWYIADPAAKTDADKAAPRLDRLRRNVATALRVADQYVWIYGEKSRWWPVPRTDLTKTWEETMPGCSAALAFARDPVSFGRQRIADLKAAGKLNDLILNGDFTAAKVALSGGSVVEWKEGATPAGWGSWQADSSKGSFTWDREIGAIAKGSARAAAVADGCFTQAIPPVKPGEHYAVQGLRRLKGSGTAWLRVRWQTAEGKWVAEERDRLIYTSAPADQWGEMFDVVEVPEGVGKLVLLLCVGGQRSADDVAWFDEVHIYKLD